MEIASLICAAAFSGALQSQAVQLDAPAAERYAVLVDYTALLARVDTFLPPWEIEQRVAKASVSFSDLAQAEPEAARRQLDYCLFNYG
jgi:hypothetical protein